jgi:two-component system CheB/CheR fusion protein
MSIMEARDEWALTFNAVPDLIAILDNQHRIVRVNTAMAKRLGCTPDELTGMTCYQAVHGTDGPPLVCPHSRLLADGKEHHAEVHDDRLGGDFLVSVSPLHASDGTLKGSVHVARDISAQKLAEEQARQAVTRRDQFLAMLSHELRNPLGAILNAAYVVKSAASGSPPFNDGLAVIERQTQQMANLLDDLLDVTRVMQGKIEIRQEAVQLVDTITEAVKVVQPLLDTRKQQLRVQMDDTQVRVEGDPTRLQQILVNLLTNAVKYTPSDGWIHLALRQEGNEAVVSVRDTGRGLPPEKLESIFELFVQVEPSLHRQEGGMGVGLTLVRMLVEMHNGTVSARSDGPGTGSQFVVRLPLAVEQRKEPQHTARTPEAAASSRVLIVEDNADSRMMLQALLQIDGHQVRVAEDGPTGLETLDREDFDVALIDIGLPGIDGYEVARQFCARRVDRRPRLVALTGYGRPADRQAVLEAGFDEHLVKPCDPEDLATILRVPR